MWWYFSEQKVNPSRHGGSAAHFLSSSSGWRTRSRPSVAQNFSCDQITREWKPLLGLTLSLSSFSELTTSTTKWTQKLLQMLMVWRVHHTGRGAWDLSTSPTMRNVPPWRREPRCGAGSCFLTESWSLISQETVWNWNYTYQLLKKMPITSTNTHLYLFVLSKATRAFSAKHFCHHKKRELRVVQHPHGDFCLSPKLILLFCINVLSLYWCEWECSDIRHIYVSPAVSRCLCSCVHPSVLWTVTAFPAQQYWNMIKRVHLELSTTYMHVSHIFGGNKEKNIELREE